MSPLRVAVILPLFALGVAAACGTNVVGGGGAAPSSSSGSTGGAAGQCASVGETCTAYAEPDGGIDIEPPCCGTALCLALPCCYSDCEGMCQPPGGSCCNAGAQCGSDSECCSGTCANQDAGSPGFGPGGTCM